MNKSPFLLVIYSRSTTRNAFLALQSKYRVSWIQLDQHHPMWDFHPRQLTEPLHGPDGDFLRAIIDNRPNLILIEMDSINSPSNRIIHLLKTSAATRRIPIVGLSQSDQDLEQALQAGADDGLVETEWSTHSEDLMEKWIAKIAADDPGQACQGGMHPLAVEGISAVNRGHYYLAHELLEEAWMSVDDAEGRLYRALLQVAVTYLQVQRQNWRGALKMLLRMRQWIDPLPPICKGVAIAELRRNMVDLRTKVDQVLSAQSAGPGEDWLRPIPMHTSKD